jgi:hypothetical protein
VAASEEHRDLNRAKFAVINAMESRLPARIFSDEWAMLRPPATGQTWSGRAVAQWMRRYWELGAVERGVPVVFAAIYLGILISRI